MKNSIKYIFAALLLGATATSCREEHLLGDGEGRMMLQTSVKSDVKVASRVTVPVDNDALCEQALIWISEKQTGKLLHRFEGRASFPNDGIALPSGTYVVEGWTGTGDSIPASFDVKRFKGYEEVTISRGDIQTVNLVCKIRNTVVSVNYSDELKEILKDLRFTVSLNDGVTAETDKHGYAHGLTFEGEAPAKGYYMLNSRTEGFNWTLEGTELSGNKFTKSGTYTDPAIEGKPGLANATEYIFNLKYEQGGEIEIGGAYFSIDVVPEPAEGDQEEIFIALAPEIKGSGFDISQPVVAEPGAALPQSITINSSEALQSVRIGGNLLTAGGLAEEYDLIKMDQSKYGTTFGDKGISIRTFPDGAPLGEATGMRITISETYLNALPKGDYNLDITAASGDAADKVSKATFSISLSDAPATPAPAPAETSFTSATISATLTDATATFDRLGFEVKKIGNARSYEDWTFVEAVRDGSTLTANLTDLEDGMEYAYRVVADDFTSAEITFTTPAYPQLPNAGFEEWTTEGGGYAVAYGAGQDKFWDSGNQGAWSLKQNVTTADNTVKHSGTYSAKLESARPNMFGIGKFAAGNIFIGQYLKTDGTDGELGWGRPWTVKPKALKGYIKYKPVEISHVEGKNVPDEYVKGDMDRGIIYIAMLNDELKEYNGTKTWPVIVKTKSQELFDKNGSNVIAYGEKVFTETEGDGMIEFEIPLNDVNPGTVAYIMITASASKGGDYFAGGVGSTMWLDDLELVY